VAVEMVQYQILLELLEVQILAAAVVEVNMHN
jgi:hypothetical protein